MRTYHNYTEGNGSRIYELKNHLGNVLATVSDRKLASTNFSADVLTTSDYYAFGMQMPGRTDVAGDGYNYGFNGMEKDDEVAGEGNSYTAEFWQYDSRLGRRWNIDPVNNYLERKSTVLQFYNYIYNLFS